MTDLDYTLPDELSKRYKLLALLGSGGAGQVFRAKDLVLDSIVAIKVLNSSSNDKMVLRLQREAIVLGKLKHKNITGIIDFNIVENVPYIIAEYVEGKTLSNLIEEDKFDFEEKLDLAIQICKALSYAHDHSVVHRDVKPENIMVTSDEHGELLVKVLDFGLAKSEKNDQFLTTSGSFVGTPLYASPEQIKGKKTDYKTDIYSLGILLFYLFSKNLPYEAENTIRLAEMHINNPIPELLNDELNSETINTIKSCLEKNPSDRPKNADSIRVLLQSNYLSEKEEEIEKEVKKETSSGKVLVFSVFLIVGILTSVFLFKDVLFKSEIKRTATKPKQLNEEEEFKVLLPKIETAKFPKLQEENVVKFRSGSAGQLIAEMGKAAEDNTLKQLEGKNIKVLSLWHNPLIKGSGLKYIEKCPLLQLILSKTRLQEKYLIHVARISSLRQLHMSKCPTLTDETMQLIQPLRDLEELELTSRQLTNDGLKEISNFKNLRSLIYGGSKQIDDNCISYLKKLPKLTSLGLPNTGVSSNVVSKMLSLKNLRAVNISGIQVINKSTIADLVKLNPYSVDLSDTNLRDNHLYKLVEAKDITVLNISNTLVSSEGIRQLARLPNLKSLQLKRMSIDTKFAIELCKLKLEILDLYCSNINDSNLNLLARMKNLNTLHLNKCANVSRKGVKQFKRSFLNQQKRTVNATF